jgi:hypothetical protein
MANVYDAKYALTTLFPIKGDPRGGDSHYVALRDRLRELDHNQPCGSPLSKIPFLHMARFAIVDNLIYQGMPARRDRLKSRYLLFMCDFDGESVDPLVSAMITHLGGIVDEIWRNCVAYPGTGSRDRLIAYFERCQLYTDLFFADRPKDDVRKILRALMYKRQFAQFVEDNQRLPRTGLKDRFEAMMDALGKAPTPAPGSM